MSLVEEAGSVTAAGIGSASKSLGAGNTIFIIPSHITLQRESLVPNA